LKYNHEDTLIFVHVGKCAGNTVWDAIEKSEVIAHRYLLLHHTHVAKPPLLSKAKYIFAIRDPVSRTLSAFNYMKELLNNPKFRERYPGQLDIIKKYGYLNVAAERLYEKGSLNREVAVDLRSRPIILAISAWS
jgi:hypothetical protein